MQPRRAIPLDLRVAVIARDGLTCQLCTHPVVDGGDPNAGDRLNLDHVIQWAIGGPDTLENLRVVCRLCNSTRPRPITEETAARRARERPLAAARRARRRELAGWTPAPAFPRSGLTARQRRQRAASQ